jgi:hypothetical protein
VPGAGARDGRDSDRRDPDRGDVNDRAEYSERQEYKERQEYNERQEYKERQEYYERQEYKEYQEFREDRFQFVVGASLSMAAFRSLTCTSNKIIVNGTVFYSCGGHWYNPVYQGTQVTYVIVNAPSGY